MPSLLPGFEYDIFISYRQKDNKYDGWVTEFVDNLKKELEATFKEDISIYFDSNAHDGLLETHNVNKSLEGKLKCLIFIPILSQTYCDTKSFAWSNELLPFLKFIEDDEFGKSVKLLNGNIADRFLPVRIHDLDGEDQKLFESATQSVLRPVDFIYRLPGVNRQLRAKDDEQIKSANQVLYRDQINKVAQAIKDIINAMKNPQATAKVSLEQKKESVVTPTAVKRPVAKEPKEKSSSKIKYIGWVVPIVLLVAVGFWFVPQFLNKQRAKNELLPAIQKLVDENFAAPSSAFELAQEAAKLIPKDSALIRLWPKVSRSVTIETAPSGATVFWKDYDKPTDAWKKLGITPLQNTRIPFGITVKMEKEGFETIVATSGCIAAENLYKMDSVTTLPKNMVRIPGKVTDMYIVGLEQNGGKKVGEFLADRFEVSNKEFKSFVDAGGYTNKKYWNFPIRTEEKVISWEEAMKLFVDKTGKQGPAGWEVGIYPSGKENHPVAGVSWYEAAAYAAFAGKQLPTVFHWSVLAETGRTKNIVPFSNFNGNSTAPVGSQEGISSFGIYDLAGNVREWCSNTIGNRNAHYILGGGWNDPSYAFNDAYGASPIDRSLTNGFRCIKNLPGDTTLSVLTPPVNLAFRDYLKEKPVDDKTFNIFLRQFAYDKSPIDAQQQTMADTGIWKIEKVTMSAAYANDELIVYLFLPRDKQPPYQPIFFFPGSNVIYQNKFDGGYADRVDFLVRSGRAIIYPVFKGTFERRDELNSDLADESVFYKDHVIMWRKDIGRAIDYLESRPDMMADKIGYFGWSWGGFMGGIIPAIEKRIKAVVLHVGGMEMNRALPEVDQINFLPRVYQPIIMLNGKHDLFFPVETSQKPMFELLGTPKKDKKIIIYDAGHRVPRTELIKESLFWYDQYLGPVKN
jgi:eukaryotic-like serine/threonine-protein kinase